MSVERDAKETCETKMAARDPFVFSRGFLSRLARWTKRKRYRSPPERDYSKSRYLRASALETEADLEIKVGRVCLKLVHKVVMWTYVKDVTNTWEPGTGNGSLGTNLQQ